jgi:type 1 fimbria pilin
VFKLITEEGLTVPSLRPLLLLPLVLAAVLLPGAAQSAGKDNNLTATVGPGFSIRLTDSANNAVTHLDPGAYTITVKNLSPTQEHNFHLLGPGVDMASNFDNVTVVWNVTFVDGKYTYHCDAHPTQMKGGFTVGTVTTPPPTPKLTGKVGPKKTISLTKGSAAVKTLAAGAYKLSVSDRSKSDNFHLSGPGVNKKTGVKFTGSAAWNIKLRAGTYTFRSDATKKLRRTFKVG